MPGTISDIIDGVSTSVAVKVPCIYTTSANIALSGLAVQGGGTWATTLEETNRVFVKNQTNPIDNGIWLPGVAAWSRAKDFDGARDVTQGTLIPVFREAGEYIIYAVSTANPIYIGTTALTFEIVFDQSQDDIVPPTCGRLSNLITGSGPNPGADPFDECHFIPHNGNKILVDGVTETIPDGALAASGGIRGDYSNCYVDRVPGQTLADATIYFIYVAKVSGVLVLNFSTTGYDPQDPTYGLAVKLDDAGSTFVGMCRIKYVSGVPTTFGGAHGQTIISYYNRFKTSLFTQVIGSAVASTTLVALPKDPTVFGMPGSNYMEWVQFYDSAPITYFYADSGNPTSVGSLLTLDMGITPGATTGFNPTRARAVTADQQCIPMPGRGKQADATGHYSAEMLYKVSAGAAYFSGLAFADGLEL
jgi:hypothetical protein